MGAPWKIAWQKVSWGGASPRESNHGTADEHTLHSTTENTAFEQPGPIIGCYITVIGMMDDLSSKIRLLLFYFVSTILFAHPSSVLHLFKHNHR
jgi:hypothetical protein